MISTLPTHGIRASAHPTVWGLDPTQLHDHFWAARGVQVVRLGESAAEGLDGAELFLLTDPRTLVIFRLRPLVELLSWVKPDVLFLRLKNNRESGFKELVVTDEGDRFMRFRRDYGGVDTRLARVAITRDPRIVRFWQGATDTRAAWRQLRQETRRARRETMTLSGRAYDRATDGEVSQFVRDLVHLWKHPDATIPGLKKLSPGVWAYRDAFVDAATKCVGPIWIGAGRYLDGGRSVLGPAALWDDPAARPLPQSPRWDQIEPAEQLARTARPRKRSSLHEKTKRAFDVVFAVVALLVTLPVYPLVMLAIWLEDGRPFFFGHLRETRGGREFPCYKFRSMRKDAEQIKAQLEAANQADGPQFFIKDDPRLTRVGRFIRKCNIDELPQFWNVLLGDMSIVGPRPSPRKENQFCPPWREARLSVRPGITGLWQVKRTRRAGYDFQEWIKYDIEYVERSNWWTDLYVIVKTFGLFVRGSNS
jgi:lipopolysaccharide/colanic/teichoic acid biosynthesis glycosyltransferase